MVVPRRRVVITGLGIISPLGIGPEATWSALREGRGGVSRLDAFPIDGLPSDAAGEVKDFSPKALAVDKHRKALQKNLKYMARDIQLAVAAAELAVVDGKLLDGQVDPARIGIDLGAGMISSDLDELAPAINLSTREDGSFDFETYGKAGIPEIEPLWMLKYLPNMLACHISILNDCRGPSNTITQGEAAANAAIGEAFRIIQRGQADVMITGGADSKIHPLSFIRMKLNGVNCRWEGEPSAACRPFDVRRCGVVPGEGAGILVVEELEHARRRGATIYGELIGFGSASDANPRGGLHPEGRGTELAIRAALRDAGLEPSQIGHINAHGWSTVEADLAEARAYTRLFGPGVPVVGLKGYTANTASGCGAIELIASLLATRHGLLPATLNCDELDPRIELDVVRGEPRTLVDPTFVNVNFNRYGQVAALAVRGGPVDDAS
ncbi:beta-ketoacyl-[acyl-carrier-protein] synthase family protein [Tautonia sociabilis]|uniref:Beta-ketoacyl-[acyl-carrier-protein] synthase family protein n=1 Tax=Tautonia sociabilis TaxID=2080755 RepID=A0A432MN19_9BACT|nr:beta-ketoacyl-[acyl-carrier-protein] synthase family protein [Tautonia sociabilis]RUL88495.1 beta-ketoacyl-[acyl-carrier-protein] synthase family protein [Tautonia sociabilis]